MKNRGILIVDNQKDYREKLVKELKEKFILVEGAASGKEAIKKLSERPSEYHFAVIDHQLEENLDGIETTAELLKISPNIYPVVFSNIPSDDPRKIAQYKFEALKAGAYRYLEKTTGNPKSIVDFINEIEQLESLRNWVSDFFEARASAPSLLTQLNVGTDIIDSQYKIWYMSDTMRKIIGIETSSLPKAPCAHWHGYTCYPCPGCKVKESFEDSKPHESIFLSPLIYRKDRELFYMKVWTQPVTNSNGEIIYGTDKKPLAIMESVSEITYSPELKAMPLDKRLDIIAKALKFRTKDDPLYCSISSFDIVRIYMKDNAGFKLMAAEGLSGHVQKGTYIHLRELDGDNLAFAENNMKDTGCGCFFENAVGANDPVHPQKRREKYFYWPIIEKQETIALVEVCGSHITKDIADKIVPPYAAEVFSAILDSRNLDQDAKITEEAMQEIARIEKELQTMHRSSHGGLPEEQLKVIVKGICELTDSRYYVLRYSKDEQAVLLKLNIPDFSGYEQVAEVSYPISANKLWSGRTISSSMETIATTIENSDIIEKYKKSLNKEAREIVKEMHSFCYEPLILDGNCIGSVGFHSPKKQDYGKKKQIITSSLAKKAAMALHDYLIGEETREKAEADAMLDILGLVLHNIKNPLATAQIALSRLESKIEANREIYSDVSGHIAKIRDKMTSISHIREEVLKLKQPWQTRIEDANLKELLEETTKAITEPVQDIMIDYSYLINKEAILIDKAALKLCMQVLLQNAADELSTKDGDRIIKVILRDATYKEKSEAGEQPFMLSVDVIDNGGGIDTDIAATLFKKLKSNKTFGLGMGLMHCRAIAMSARGYIYFDNIYSEGTKFTLTFPYK